MYAFYILVVAVLLQGVIRANILVETNVGQILGVRATDGKYTSFMGIPYGEVDKSNPFGVSTRYPKFEEPFMAFYDSAICPQLEGFNNKFTGTLDCLQLNVYVPDAASPTNPLPVLVWIHGGYYRAGFANRYKYGPSYIVRHDIILVTVNYRLGPYGFMCLDTPQVPGNQGLKDQLLGLRWIKENIEFFGGDPNQVTAFGQSAGSMSVHLHLLSPQEELFQKAIMHSGSGFTPKLFGVVDRTAPLKLAEGLGFVTSDMEEALKFLASQTTDSVIQAATEIDLEFWPCVESDHEGVEKIVTDFTINMALPKIQGKSVLLGFVEDEQLVMYANMAPEKFENITIFHDYIKDYFTFDANRSSNIENIVKSFYLGGKDLSRDMMNEIAKYRSDFMLIHPLCRCIPSFLENGADKLFLFKFSYIGKRNFNQRLYNISFECTGHTDEIYYLFDMQLIPEEPTLMDQLMIDRMTVMWTNFVKHGDPTPATSTIVPVKWQPITAEDTVNHCLNINLELTMEVNPFNERMSFWNLIYEAFPENQRGYRRNQANSLNIIRIFFLVIVIFLVF